MAAVRPGPGAAEVPSRRVPAAARGGAPGRARCVDAPGSRLFRFRCRSRLREDGGGCGGLGSAGHFQTAGVCMQPQCPESVGARRGYVPKTSLSSPPWPEVVVPDPVEEARHHAEVVEKVNELIARGRYGRLFAVVHFASHQWKVTSEDLILIENKLDVACGERIRLEKVRLSCWLGPTTSRCSADPSSGNVLSDAGGEAGQRGSRHTCCSHQAQHAYASHCGKDLVQVEATVIEKTESWPKINMRFKKRKNYKRKRIIVSPQTVLRINTIRIAPRLC
ncbi:large ribosomal subunit protein bL21m isoform X2 [Tursiops truncatus]|uniref:large ribosomal subunit protein bL21m isoform X2 n=1 Tax=Tursiops truncatus TaxID=9739 RepID=UPI003CCF26EA